MTTKLVCAAVAAGVLYAARRYYRNWGTTKGECRMHLAGDELIKPPATRTTEGVTVEAPAAAAWRQLVQELCPEKETLAAGDVVHLATESWFGRPRGMALVVEQVSENSALVLRGSKPEFPWQTVMSFHVLPRLEDRCRLLVRTRTALRRPGEVLLVESAGPAMAFLTRGMLLGIKHRAEGREAQDGVNSRSGSEPNMKRLPVTLIGRIRT